MEGPRYYRFIGGPADGRMLECDPRWDKVNVPLTEKDRLLGQRSVPFIYTRRMLSVRGGFISYFAPEDWADVQAMRHLFEFAPDAFRKP